MSESANLEEEPGSVNLEGARANGRLSLRYEDVAQDGRIMLQTVPVALSVIWRAIPIPDAIRKAMREKGIIPILSRYEVEAGEGPFPVDKPLDVRGGFSLAHSVDDKENVERIFLDMDAELIGVTGRTNVFAAALGFPAVAGRLRAEHIFTRPFAPPGERKVLALDVDDASLVPKTRRVWRAPATAIDPPEDARAIDDSFVEDPVRVALGVMHTDSNQHVNSLVYPRLFEEAALRRFALLGRPTTVLARTLDIAYRRPSFAGESLRIFVRAYENACTGLFFGQNDDVGDFKKARAFVRMHFA